jgi:hypothetical protein
MAIANKGVADMSIDSVLDLTGPTLTIVVAGLILGYFAGFVGGALGGGIDTYFFSPWARILDATGRRAVARVGIENGRFAGAVLGVIFGGITSAFCHIVTPTIVILGALCSCSLFVWWLYKGLTESVEGLAGGIFGGAISGIIAGYLGIYLMR